jgi:hypothetical protein
MNEIENLDRPPPTERRQSWLTVLGLGCGSLVAVCCGTCAIVGYVLFVPQIDQSPAEVERLTQEIVDMRLPDDFEPQQALRWDNWLFAARICIYQHRQGRGALQLTEMTIKLGDPAVAEAQIRSQLAEQDSLAEIRVLKVDTSEEREFTLRGQPVQFLFDAGEDVSSATRYHEVSGQFPGKNGPAKLILQVEDTAWNEAAVVEMLNSLDSAPGK